MTQPIRFLFDECVSRPVVETQIAESLLLYGAEASVDLGKYSRGVKDRVWIPEIAEEGGWIVVSMDPGQHSRKSERLPIICRAFRVTHVTLSAGLEKPPCTIAPRPSRLAGRNLLRRRLTHQERALTYPCVPYGTGLLFVLSRRLTL